jgi:hypothetical protein
VLVLADTRFPNRYVSCDGNVFGHHAAGTAGKSPFTVRASCIDSHRRSLLTLAPGGHVVVVRKVEERDGLIQVTGRRRSHAAERG